MKKALLLLVFLALLSPRRALAEDPRALNLRIEPHFLIFTEAGVDLQFRLSDHFSAGPVFSYMFYGNGFFASGRIADRIIYDDRTKRLGLGARGAWYYSGVDVHSFYAALMFRHLINQVSSSGYFLTVEPNRSGKFSETEVGTALGWQWVLRRLTFNAGLGAARYFHPDSVTLADSSGANTSTVRLAEQRWGLLIEAGMGFRF